MQKNDSKPDSKCFLTPLVILGKLELVIFICLHPYLDGDNYTNTNKTPKITALCFSLRHYVIIMRKHCFYLKCI